MKKMIGILLLPLMAQAAPGPVTRALMEEPATLFDVGMVRLENLTDWIRDNVGFVWTVKGQSEMFRKDINSRYSPEDDRIYVSISVSSDDATEKQMQEGCQMALGQTRIVLAKSLPGLFEHAGAKSGAGALQEGDVRDLFELRCYVSSLRSSAEGRFWAHQTLADEEMTIGRWKLNE